MPEQKIELDIRAKESLNKVLDSAIDKVTTEEMKQIDNIRNGKPVNPDFKTVTWNLDNTDNPQMKRTVRVEPMGDFNKRFYGVVLVEQNAKPSIRDPKSFLQLFVDLRGQVFHALLQYSNYGQIITERNGQKMATDTFGYNLTSEHEIEISTMQPAPLGGVSRWGMRDGTPEDSKAMDSVEHFVKEQLGLLEK